MTSETANGAAPGRASRRKPKPAESIHVAPALVDCAGAAAIAGISPRLWERMQADGRVPEPVRVASCVRWRVRELVAWCEAGCPARAQWRYDPAPSEDRR